MSWTLRFLEWSLLCGFFQRLRQSDLQNCLPSGNPEASRDLSGLGTGEMQGRERSKTSSCFSEGCGSEAQIMRRQGTNNNYKGFPNSSAGKECACNSGDPALTPGLGRSAGEGIGYPLQYSWAFLLAKLVKNHLQCRGPGFDPWVGKIPWRRESLSTPVFRPAEFHGLVHGVTKIISICYHLLLSY